MAAGRGKEKKKKERRRDAGRWGGDECKVSEAAAERTEMEGKDNKAPLCLKAL